MYRKIIGSIVLAGLFTGCTPSGYNQPNQAVPAGENTQKGALYGALAGAVIGGLTSGHNDREKHILQGAALGAIVGGAYGYSLDRQAAEMAKALNTNVDNSPNAQLNPNKDIIVSNRGQYVLITFRDSMMFATDVDTPTPSAAQKISRVSGILNNYPQTIVQVVGHTDNRGSFEHNLDLSKRRARNVANMLKSSGITNPDYAKGCSYNKAIAPNNSEANMALNRRVELYLYPSKNEVINPCR